jgi:hypothetical protein
MNILRLEKIVAHYAMADFLRANPKNKRKIRKDGTYKHNPYSLSPLTNEAREILNLARQKENISKEDEARVKYYLLKHLFINDEIVDISSRYSDMRTEQIKENKDGCYTC